MTLIKKGAEANLLLKNFSEELYPSDIKKVLVKHRIPKEYRIEELDMKLRRLRTSLESKLISDAKRAGVPTPIIYKVDRVKMSIFMEYVKGRTIKEILEEVDSSTRRGICKKIGQQIAQLHKAGIIHGDITTSNIIKTEKNKIYFIDFGLGEYNSSTEARGTDIHLLHRTLKSSHFKIAKESFKAVLEGYRAELGDEAKKVIKRVKKIESRGRYIAKEERL